MSEDNKNFRVIKIGEKEYKMPILRNKKGQPKIVLTDIPEFIDETIPIQEEIKPSIEEVTKEEITTPIEEVKPIPIIKEGVKPPISDNLKQELFNIVEQPKPKTEPEKVYENQEQKTDNTKPSDYSDVAQLAGGIMSLIGLSFVSR